MSPSRAEEFSARLVTFYTSARNRKLAENEPKFDSQLNKLKYAATLSYTKEVHVRFCKDWSQLHYLSDMNTVCNY